jgi:hypothetical protein
MSAYTELKAKQQKEINEFPISFAFNNEQFARGMKKLGLEKEDTDEVVSVGAGGFIRKSNKEVLLNLMCKHTLEFEQEIKKDKDGTGFIFDMFLYELENHEYCCTHDIEPTLDALGLTMEEVNQSTALKAGLKAACAIAGSQIC